MKLSHTTNYINNSDSKKKNRTTTNDIVKIGWNIFGMVAITVVGGLTFFKWYFPDGGIPAENLLALLSFLLAFFSIGLSVFFYFKANDSANLFYDNTYKFTKETSELLGRIEAGFGEKLTNIQRANTELSNKIDFPKIAEEEIQKQIIENKKELEIIKENNTKSINELLNKTNLVDTEKDRIKEELAIQSRKTEELEQENMILRSKLETYKIEDAPTNSTLLEKLKLKDGDLLKAIEAAQKFGNNTGI